LRFYKAHPIEALAYQLIAIRQTLERGSKGIPDLSKHLNLSIESLYPHSSFDRISRKFFWPVLEGKVTFEQEELLRKLGVKF
jgi:hypothetical protein